MEIALTTPLLKYLIQTGYRYCLSKTCLLKGHSGSCIVLKPVKDVPLASRFPDDFEEYFLIEEEPTRLAEGIEEVLTIVRLEKLTLTGYIGSLLGHDQTGGYHG